MYNNSIHLQYYKLTTIKCPDFKSSPNKKAGNCSGTLLPNKANINGPLPSMQFTD